MENATLEIERILWAISVSQRWDTVVLGCNALQTVRMMITQYERERNEMMQKESVRSVNPPKS